MSSKIYYAFRLKGNNNKERNFYVAPEQWVDRIPSDHTFDFYVEEQDAINLLQYKSNLILVGRFRKFPRNKLNKYYQFKYESPEAKREKLSRYRAYVNN